MNSFKKFSEDNQSDKCEFFSFLKDESISEKDYQRANNVWNAFKMKTMDDYHDLYLKTDVLLLADVFEKFIKTYLDYYGSDLKSSLKRTWIIMDQILFIILVVLD